MRIINGPFKGIEGRVTKITGQKRVIVEHPELCSVATAYIPKAFLIKLCSCQNMKKKDIAIVIITLIVPFLIITPFCIKKCESKEMIKNGARRDVVNHGSKPDPAICEHPDGIDLSHHNVGYDWSKVDAKFVYVRATFGNSIKDRRYDIHRKAAARHDIPTGAYHFLVANVSARKQFDFFASVVEKGHITLRPMLDIEESAYWRAPKGFSDAGARKLIREWCDLCKKRYGKAPVIYTTEKLYARYGLDKGFSDCLWWVANYNNIANYEKKCSMPYIIHQYSDKKYVEGFYGRIDCNRLKKGKTVKMLML